MEFLIGVIALAIAGYIGYKYYQARTALGTEPTILDLAQEVKVDVEAVEAKAEVAVEAVKTEAKKKGVKSPAKAEVAEKRARVKGKFKGDDKSTTDVNEAFKDGVSPAKKSAKKKPNMKVVK